MIAAIDTDGNIYTALTQVNTDSEVVIAFLSRLTMILTARDNAWRYSTILVLDGAAYHKSAETRAYLKKLGC
jgi:transposase